jgi:hypothetical protein
MRIQVRISYKNLHRVPKEWLATTPVNREGEYHKSAKQALHLALKDAAKVLGVHPEDLEPEVIF